MTFQTFAEAEKTISSWRKEGCKIVFTNGCFDLLHYGHISYLLDAKALGDKLIVGVNSDASVQILKGPTRPIKDQKSRAHILSHLDMVDMVIIFNTETPLDLITDCRPDVLVKGGDYQIHEIVGADLVQETGGVVQTLGFEAGYSSSAIIEKIKNT